MATFAVILPAAGKSTRFGDVFYKKPFVPLEGRPVWMHSAEKFANRPDVVQTILAVDPDDLDDVREKFGGPATLLGVELVAGGKERSDTVAAALARVRPAAEFVAVHDAARPCLAEEWIDRVFAAAQQHGAALLAVPVAATLKRVGPQHKIEATIPRDQLWEAQTPQVFRRTLLLEAYARRGNEPATDDCQLVERLGEPVAVVSGSALNLKLTTKDDLRLAAAILKILPKPKLLGGPAHPFADDQLWR